MPADVSPLARRWQRLRGQFAHREALVAETRRWTFEAMGEAVEGRSSDLRSAGAGLGHRIGIAVEEVDEAVVWWLAAVETGCAPLLVDPTLTARERAAVVAGGRLDGLLSSGGWERRPVGPSSAGEPVLLFHTSGSTGVPVVVEHTQRTLCGALPEPSGVPLAWLSTLGAHSMAGYTSLAQSLLCGHRLVTAGPFHPRVTLEVLVRERVAVMATTPSALRLMTRSARHARLDFPDLLVIGVGGGLVPREVVAAARDVFGCDIVVAYGLTETAGPVALVEDGPGGIDDGAIGDPLPGWDVEVRDEGGGVAAVGEEGELFCRRRAPGGGGSWTATGDLAVRLADGRFRVVGRRDDVVNHGGRKVSTAEIEGVLESHPAVRHAAAVGVPGRHAGEEDIWAFVVPDGEPTTSQHLVRFCRDRLAPFKVPARIVSTETLPTSEDGKVRKYHLREMAISQLGDRTSPVRPFVSEG